MRDRTDFDLALRLWDRGAPLGELYAFISGLYFRAKLAYAGRFGAAFIIAAGRGLLPPETPITIDEFRRIASVSVDPSDPRYREPLERDARRIRDAAGAGCEFVLLGSIASAKYLDPLFAVFGEQLLFPVEFVGRGDMSRGGLLLRCVQSGAELAYEPVGGATRFAA